MLLTIFRQIEHKRCLFNVLNRTTRRLEANLGLVGRRGTKLHVICQEKSLIYRDLLQWECISCHRWGFEGICAATEYTINTLWTCGKDFSYGLEQESVDTVCHFIGLMHYESLIFALLGDNIP